MTEHTVSSQAYRDYMSARERTSHWVRSYGPRHGDLYSPSVPPSVIDGYIPSSPPSEADSSHSTPPKMVLRYSDGRPDIPIPRPNGGYSVGRSGSGRHQHPSVTRSQTLSQNQSHSRVRTGSTPSIPRSHPHAPEEIRILPSFGQPTSSSSSRPTHARSKSVPRGSDHDLEPVPQVPFIPPSHLQTQSPYHSSRPISSRGTSPNQVSFAPPAQPSQPWHPRQPHKHPPAIIYAPSSNSQHPRYSPPAMYHHPPQTGPNGVMYSHSAPMPGQYPPQHAIPYPPGGGPHHAASEVGHGRDRTRSLGPSARRPINPVTGSVESLNGRSENSGSTYYVLPSEGQKVHVIAPSPDQSVYTASSTTKSPTSPHYTKKAFFQRLFGFAKFSSANSSPDTDMARAKLHRRHSVGASSRNRVERVR